jgi:hypothetical protein
VAGLSRARTNKPLEFFCHPVKFGCPITAKSCAAIVVRQAQRLRRLGRAAAAHSTGLRPVHFIEAAINRGPNLPEGIRNHYNSVMIGKQKVFAEKIITAVRVFEIKSPRAVVIQLQQCNAKILDGPLVRPYRKKL